MESIRTVENKRLVYYSRRADNTYWDEHWNDTAGEEIYEKAGRGFLGRFERPFCKYLPKNGPILEAGCGLGQFVIALRNRGYDARGIDFAPDTIRAIKERYPDIPVEIGDATNIDFPDETFAAYISLGVVEHVPGGPTPFLKEAFRVLLPDGVAILTVPSFNVLRRIRAQLGGYRGERPVDAVFYQYAFSIREFTEIVRSQGFEIISTGGYDSYKSLKDDIYGMHRLFRLKLFRYHVGSVVQRMLEHVKPMERYCGHMLMVIARKPRVRQLANDGVDRLCG